MVIEQIYPKQTFAQTLTNYILLLILVKYSVIITIIVFLYVMNVVSVV